MDDEHVDDGYGPVTPEMIARLRETRPWVQLIGMLGFVTTGLMIAAAFTVLVVGRLTPFGAANRVVTVASSVLYLLAATIYFFISLYLTRYAGSIGRLLATRLTEHLEQALGHQRNFWRIVGIFAIVYMVVAVITLVLIVVVTRIDAAA